MHNLHPESPNKTNHLVILPHIYCTFSHRFTISLTYKMRPLWPCPPLPSRMPSGESFAIVKLLKIGFTYDSHSDWITRGFSADQYTKFESDETIESIAASLRKLGTVEMVRAVKSLAKRLVSSQPDWDVVFNICEGYGTVGREPQAPAILDAWGTPSHSPILPLFHYVWINRRQRWASCGAREAT